MLTKSDYLKYLDCPSFLWFWKQKQDVLSPEKEDPYIERLKLQGYEVELVSRDLYPSGVLVTGKLEGAVKETNKLIEKGTTALFQASFLHDDVFASCDMLIWNDLFDGWDMIEVKSSTDKDKKKKEHILDAAFQRIIAQRAGLKVINVYLLELNKDYLKDGTINPQDLFNESEITSECISQEASIIAEIDDAKNLLRGPAPTSCSCRYKGRRRHCRAFDYLYPEVPNYSIYDLRAIGNSKRKLTDLVDRGHLRIEDIPADFKLSKTHQKQKWVRDHGQVIIDKDVIKTKLDDLIYPLYFLDYETLACGIPKFDKTYPYQQTVFQYSIHILKQNGDVKHKEYIHKKSTTPVHIMASRLKEDIGDIGNVIVWNKAFEGKCNADLAAMNPELESFMIGLNERIFDLMEIFQKMDYVDDAFKGSYSIKNILPVMCPDLDYSELDISNGTQAVVEYEKVIFSYMDEAERTENLNNLLDYCKLDTWAMVRIFQELEILIKRNVE